MTYGSRESTEYWRDKSFNAEGRIAVLREALNDFVGGSAADQPLSRWYQIKAHKTLSTLDPAADRLLRERELLRKIEKTAREARSTSEPVLALYVFLDIALTALREFDKEKT